MVCDRKNVTQYSKRKRKQTDKIPIGIQEFFPVHLATSRRFRYRPVWLYGVMDRRNRRRGYEQERFVCVGRMVRTFRSAGAHTHAEKDNDGRRKGKEGEVFSLPEWYSHFFVDCFA